MKKHVSKLSGSGSLDYDNHDIVYDIDFGGDGTKDFTIIVHKDGLLKETSKFVKLLLRLALGISF